MTKEEIVKYNTTNQIKIYKLNQIGLTSKEIVDVMTPLFTKNTNPDKRVYYVNSILKEFIKDTSKIEKANKIPD